MVAWQAAVLGILQGLAEFLPISSSGHLLIGERLMGLDSTGALLEILLHVGTLAAVLIVFWDDFWSMLRHPVRDPRLRLLILATIPAVAAALLFDDAIERLFTGWFLGVSFLITAALLFIGEAVQARRRTRESNTVHNGHALAMGLMQAFAILPGVSRSGSTIIGGISAGLTRESAARFSFQMSAVAIVGSVVFKLKDLLDAGGAAFGSNWMVPLAGVLAAMVTGYVAIRWMLRLLRSNTMRPFAWYVLAVGILVLCDQLFFGKFFPKL
jgi:undecaprenyl-diphosphatase